MKQKIKCGEATIKLLAEYGVSVVFGIPGVHTLEFCRGINKYLKHILTRHEQGAGFMAEGWARATGKPAVALVISGPGVTNIATPMAQSYADSLPVLVISAEPHSNSLGKGWGVLHEITEQKAITKPITAFSKTVKHANEVPKLLAKAFEIFASKRPRPVHISIPTDVQEEWVEEEWKAIMPPERAKPKMKDVATAAEMLKQAEQPLIMVGGGAVECGDDIRIIAEAVSAIVCHTAAGKGIVSDEHPLSMGSMMVKAEGKKILKNADVILAVGTELSDTDSFEDGYTFNGDIIRVDIDETKINDLYKAKLGIVADAKYTSEKIVEELKGHKDNKSDKAHEKIKELKQKIMGNLNESEMQHIKVLKALDEIAPENTIFATDACQIAYTGQFAMPRRRSRSWFFPAGYCPLGNSLPNAIGAKMAVPENPVSVIVGDGGFMFTMPEIMVAVDAKMALPIVIWDNGSLKQIKDGMVENNIEPVGIQGENPDFVQLAKACKCYGVKPNSMEEFKKEWSEALDRDAPTVIHIIENEKWLVN